MMLNRDGCGNALLTLDSVDLHPLRREVKSQIDILSNQHSAVGIVTPRPSDTLLYTRFEYCDIDESDILIAWTNDGFVYVGPDDKLHVSSWPSRRSEPADYVPSEGMDVLIGYISRTALIDFRYALEYHRSILKRQ